MSKLSFVSFPSSKGVFAAALLIALFLLTAAAPMAQAKDGQGRGGTGEVKAYQERRGVTRFEEYVALSPELGAPVGAFYKVNVYAFAVKGGIVLVDTGVESQYAALMDAVSSKFHNKPILAVLLTHGHADHAGAGHYFVDAGIPVYASAYDTFLIQMGMHFPGMPSDFTYTGYTPTGMLNGGETLFGVTVVPTPGHSYGSVSFIDEKTDALFSGDTTICYASDDKAPLDMTFTLEYMTMMNADDASLQMQLASLNALTELATAHQVDTIFPGHNPDYAGKDVAPYIQNSIGIVTYVLMN